MKKQSFLSLTGLSRLILYSSLALLAFSLALGSCASESRPSDASPEVEDAGDLEVVEKTDAYGNTERYSRRITDYAKEGQYSLISPEGNLMETAEYHHDTLHGFRILYYENGDTQVVERYDYGVFAGPFRAYYENGALELEGNYELNSMEGIWKRYYENGQLMEEVTFHDNEENGPFTEYHQNGALKAEGYYKDGDHEHGSLKLYNEEGVLVKTMDCQYGVCKTIWEKES